MTSPSSLLLVRAFRTQFPGPLAELASDAALLSLLRGASAADPDAALPPAPDDAVRKAVRDMLREPGYKPTGRGKPSSEYLSRAAADGTLSSINLAVDACNALSLASGLPISVVDVARVTPPLRIAAAVSGSRYVFNASGQEIDVSQLFCLHDASGPCANAVKDAQRTKTRPETTATLSILWGARSLAERVERTCAAYRALLARHGATTELEEIPT